MTISDAAKRIRVSERTIERWISYGWLRTTHVPRPDTYGWQHDISLDDLIDADDRRSNYSLHCAGRRSVKA